MPRRRKRLPLAKNWRKSILSLIAALILFAASWMNDALTTVRFPDSFEPALLYSTEMHDDLGLTMGRAIERAEKSILLVIYTLNDPSIINQLREKSEAGCAVKVICDVKTSQYLENKLGREVELVKRYSAGLMHQKILVIDEQQTWIGSANMTGASLRHYGNLVLAIDSKALAATVIAKANSYTAEDPRKFPYQSFQVGGQQIDLCFLPDDSEGVLRLKKLIQTAAKTIRIAMFTWTRRDLANAVVDAKKRGVDVEVILDRTSSLGASIKIFEFLKQNGVAVKVNQSGGLMHNKCMIIDDSTLVNGSANWTKQAFQKNDDCFVILHSLNENQRNFLEETWKIIDSQSSLR